MALTARLNLRQTQSLTMTPQLLQSIKLLQFTNAELEQFVDSQVEINPLIERINENDDRFADRASAKSENKHLSGNDHNEWENTDLETSAVSISDKLDASLENVFPDDPGHSDEMRHGEYVREKPGQSQSLNLPSSSGVGDDFSLEDIAAKQRTLRDTVAEQVPFILSTIAERAIADELIDALDDRGYLDVDASALAERLGCTRKNVEDVITRLQSCDPAGLFARDLTECLALQCARANRLDPAMRTLLENLDLLAKRDFKTLIHLCGVDQNDMLDMFDEIKRLDPRPGLAFQPSMTQAIVHDLEVTQLPDGSWRVELNNDALPRIIVDRQYFNQVSKLSLKKEEKSFIAECMASASWLEKSLDQRAITILKVATEIVRQQDGFLINGVSGLKPMTMKAVADAIGMHESTVSRVASNKYMLTPRGMFEIRYFFTVGIGNTSADGEDHSSQSVRQRIKELIYAEGAENVLSDDTLVEILKKEGVDIARRTVAKYREAMNIASSVQRRREKKAKQSASLSQR